jgi:hypothetical protein
MNFSTLDSQASPQDFLELARHCDLLSAGRAMPRQQDFSVASVSWLHDRIYRLDVLNDGADYLFRSFGIFWQAAYGEDFVGKWLSEVEAFTDKLNALRAVLDHVVAARAPLACNSKLVWPGRAEFAFDRLMVPFTLDDQSVSQILVLAHCDDATEDHLFEPRFGLPILTFDDPTLMQIAS